MTTNSSFQSLMNLALHGDVDALTELLQRYETQVRIVARSRLGPLLRPYVDSIDVVQSVHRSMMDGLQNGKFEIESPQKLVALAITMVQAKIARQWRHHKRQVRDDRFLQSDARSTAADPLDELAHREEFEALLSNLPEVDRNVLQLRADGFSTAEAARKLGLMPNVVRVRLSRIRKRLAASRSSVPNAHDAEKA